MANPSARYVPRFVALQLDDGPWARLAVPQDRTRPSTRTLQRGGELVVLTQVSGHDDVGTAHVVVEERVSLGRDGLVDA
jgi:hypothetical protein